MGQNHLSNFRRRLLENEVPLFAEKTDCVISEERIPPSLPILMTLVAFLKPMKSCSCESNRRLKERFKIDPLSRGAIFGSSRNSRALAIADLES
jgi:hypothetical protein